MTLRAKPEKKARPLKKIAPSVPFDETLSEDDVQMSLERIYRGEMGELPDFASIERSSSSRVVRWILGLGVGVILLSTLAWVGFFAIEPLTNRALAEGLTLALGDTTEITLGKEEEIVLTWHNEALQPLASADVRLSFPPEFQFISADPKPTDPKNFVWDLGLLSPRREGVIRVKGLFLGALGEVGTVQAVANFQGRNTDRKRQVVVQDTLLYKETVLQGTLTASDTVLPGDVVTVQYSLQNQSTQSLENLLARIAIPSGFIPTASTTMDAETRTLQFRVGSLPAKSLTTVQVTGKFSPEVSGERLFQAQAGQERSNGFFPIQRGEKRLNVLAGELVLRMVANGSSEAAISISPGEPVRLLLSYQNTSPETLSAITLTGTVEAIIDGKSVAPAILFPPKQLVLNPVAASSTKAKSVVVTYGKEQIPAFAALAPSTQGTIELFLPTHTLKKATKDALIRIVWQSEIGGIGTTKTTRKVALPPLTLRYKSDLDLQVETRYYTEEGAPLGSGPLPPVVGNTTAYRVFWQLGKTLHTAEEIEVRAHLPRISAWSAKTQADSGVIRFDPQTRIVTWKIKRMPEDIGTLTASFEVQVTPEVADAGRFATIVEESSLDAQDATLKETIQRKKPIQTTDLQADEGANGKGVVRKPL